jgi:hypothetical protein
MPLRGGAWTTTRRHTRVSYRSRYHPVYFPHTFGVRVVVAPVLK